MLGQIQLVMQGWEKLRLLKFPLYRARQNPLYLCIKSPRRSPDLELAKGCLITKTLAKKANKHACFITEHPWCQSPLLCMDTGLLPGKCWLKYMLKVFSLRYKLRFRPTIQRNAQLMIHLNAGKPSWIPVPFTAVLKREHQQKELVFIIYIIIFLSNSSGTMES